MTSAIPHLQVVPTDTLSDSYFEAVQAFVHGAGPQALADARTLASRALEENVSLDTLIQIHHDAIRHIAPPTARESMQHERFLSEVMSAWDTRTCDERTKLDDLRSEVETLRAIARDLGSSTQALIRQRDEIARETDSMQTHLTRVTRDLELTNRKLDQAHCEQAEFSYALSHDLKTPANALKVLLGELDMVLGDDTDPDARALLDSARETSARMVRLVDDVRDYAGMIHDEPDKTSLDLELLTQEVIADQHRVLEQINADISLAPLPMVEADADQVRLLIQHLISNAIKFRSPRRWLRIDIDSRIHDDMAHITIRDNGIGIAPEYHDRIFGLFQRLHIRDDYDGNGLGLTVCKRIVSNLGGRISVRSRPDEGAAFTLTLKVPDHERDDQDPDGTAD